MHTTSKTLVPLENRHSSTKLWLLHKRCYIQNSLQIQTNAGAKQIYKNMFQSFTLKCFVDLCTYNIIFNCLWDFVTIKSLFYDYTKTKPYYLNTTILLKDVRNFSKYLTHTNDHDITQRALQCLCSLSESFSSYIKLICKYKRVEN